MRHIDSFCHYFPQSIFKGTSNNDVFGAWPTAIFQLMTAFQPRYFTDTLGFVDALWIIGVHAVAIRSRITRRRIL